jgi:hypothetical protein
MVSRIMEKRVEERSDQELALLAECDTLVRHIERARAKRALTRAHNTEIHVDAEQEMEAKCEQLARMIVAAEGACVVYTGAGVSTAASIPDYRGPQGLWTSLAKGIRVRAPDFAQCTPTYSHMALRALKHHSLVSHLVSQNCDGLHLRSGFPRHSLSELHGNCFIELCLAPDCPAYEFPRLFDTTERSAFRKHATGRFCPHHHLHHHHPTKRARLSSSDTVDIKKEEKEEEEEGKYFFFLFFSRFLNLERNRGGTIELLLTNSVTGHSFEVIRTNSFRSEIVCEHLAPCKLCEMKNSDWGRAFFGQFTL